MGVDDLFAVHRRSLCCNNRFPIIVAGSITELQQPIVLSRGRSSGEAAESNFRSGFELGDGDLEEPIVARPCSCNVGLSRGADEAGAVGIVDAGLIKIGMGIGCLLYTSDAADD